jgi:hypothetical protein
VMSTNLILMGALMLALRRWRLPFGSATLLFTGSALLMATLTELREGWTVVAALGGGLTADFLVQWLRLAPRRPSTYRVVAAAVPLVLWSAYFVLLALAYDIVWPRDLALGSIALSSLCGLLVSILVLPPALPEGAWRTTTGD